jgi:DNA repair exonuclease SbcCD nuclease subunit
MAVFLVIGDLHIHTTNLEESKLLSRHLLEIAQTNSFDVIVVLGDILDTNDIIRAEAHELAVELLAQLSKIAPLLILIGNHDVPGQLSYFSGIHGFNALKLWQGSSRENVVFPSGTGVQVVDTEVVFFHVNNRMFTALPYIPPGRFHEALATKEGWKESGIIFCHQEFQNCDLGSNKISTCKDSWSEELPQIVSGHIHKYQRLGTNILYCGSPRQVVITEDPYKTVSLIHFDNKIRETRIATRLPPRLHFLILASEVSSLAVPESGRIKIEITGTLAENNAAKASLRVKQWKKKGFVVKFHNIVAEAATLVEIPRSMGFKNVCRVKAEEAGIMEEYREIFG